MLKYYLSGFTIASGTSSLRLKPDLDAEFLGFGNDLQRQTRPFVKN